MTMTDDLRPASALTSYQALDLSEDSPIVQRLMRATAAEQSLNGRLHVSDDYDEHPALLTPQMRSWWISCIASPRVRALEELRGAFAGDTITKSSSGKGMLAESEADRLDLIRTREERRVVESFYRENGALIEEMAEARREYEELRAYEDNREAVRTRPLLYFAGLLVVVVLELFINFESFLRVPYITSPFLATGATGLVAIGIGAAAHLHGEVLKQWNWYFGPHDRVRMWKGSRKLAIGSFLLFVSIMLVAGARYYYLVPLIQEAAVLGTAPPSILASIFFMILGNFIVYAAGVAWSYYRHDDNPEYPKKLARYERARDQLERLKSKRLHADLGMADAKHKQETARVHSFESAQRNAPRHAANREAFAAFLAKDGEVMGALDRYRAELVSVMRARGAEPVFLIETVNRSEGTSSRSFTAEQWLSQPLKLKLLVGE